VVICQFALWSEQALGSLLRFDHGGSEYSRYRDADHYLARLVGLAELGNPA
jgi:hypothetical protein